MPCVAAVRTDPDGGLPTVALDEQISRVGDFLQSFAGHFKQADFAGRAKAVLHAANNAVRVEPIAFEVDDGIDDVLDDLGPGERALLGDMADEHDRDPAALGEVDEFHAAFAQLRDRARGGRQVRLIDHLDRVDDHHAGVDLVNLVGDALDVGLGEDQQVIAVDGEARRAWRSGAPIPRW